MSWGHASRVSELLYELCVIAFKANSVKTFFFWDLGMVDLGGHLWWLTDYVSSWGTTRIDTCNLLGNGSLHFFRREMHYLGNLISDKGVHPPPEKLDTIHNMPKPKSPKEIKQFLSLCGYYRKFVPHFSDIARPLLKLTAHDTKFVWDTQCDLSFQMLCSALISKYPETSKPYTIYTDASK